MISPSPSNYLPSQVDGYRAASVIVNEHLNAAEARKPKTQRYVNGGSASFREGYYQGLLFAHCMQAYGEFPAANADIIKRTLQRANAENQATASAGHRQHDR